QSFRDYTHVIVNDGGDATQVDELVDSLPSDTRKLVKVFHREVPSNAPDTILNESDGRVNSEYFAIHDDDDTWHPDYLKLLVQELENNKELGAVVARANNIQEEVRGRKIKQL